MIKIIKQPKLFKIYINDLVHLCIFDSLLGYQSWIDENGYYKIEFYTDNQSIECKNFKTIR